jgi:hypothetical protein
MTRLVELSYEDLAAKIIDTRAERFAGYILSGTTRYQVGDEIFALRRSPAANDARRDIAAELAAAIGGAKKDTETKYVNLEKLEELIGAHDPTLSGEAKQRIRSGQAHVTKDGDDRVRYMLGSSPAPTSAAPVPVAAPATKAAPAVARGSTILTNAQRGGVPATKSSILLNADAAHAQRRNAKAVA